MRSSPDQSPAVYDELSREIASENPAPNRLTENYDASNT